MQNVKYGFALGGGGTRAYSQIGAMAYLEEKGIKPTFISGTSMGAIHALLLGMGFNVQGICDFYRNKSAFSLFELSIGKNYLISNKKLGRVIKKICEAKGFKNLEDLPIKTAICVTDAKTNQPVFLSKGDIVEAILATTATYQTQMFDVQDCGDLQRFICAAAKRSGCGLNSTTIALRISAFAITVGTSITDATKSFWRKM